MEVLVNVVGGVRDHIGSDDRFHGTEKGKALDHALSQLHLVAALSGKRENGHLLRLVPVVAEDNIREQTMTHNLPSTANESTRKRLGVPNDSGLSDMNRKRPLIHIANLDIVDEWLLHENSQAQYAKRRNKRGILSVH